MSCHDWFSLCRVAVETLWNILPELKVEADEELTTRVSQTAARLPTYIYIYYIYHLAVCGILDSISIIIHVGSAV